MLFWFDEIHKEFISFIDDETIFELDGSFNLSWPINKTQSDDEWKEIGKNSLPLKTRKVRFLLNLG